MSKLPDTTSGAAERAKRRDEACEAIQDARDRNELDRIPQILAENPDLFDELQDLVDAEAELHPLPRPPVDPIAQLPFLDPLYDILEELGRGGWGVVVKARHRFLGRLVAIKLLKPTLAANPKAVRRFLEEAQIASQLQHLGIAPVHEVGRMRDGQIGFVMKLVGGQTLAQRLKERLPRKPSSAWDDLAPLLEIFLQVCRTLAYAHQTKGVLHRDLKPGNIMLGGFGEVQVMDWGLGKVVHGGIDEDPPETLDAPVQTLRCQDLRHLTESGAQIGTPSYMPPEQAKGMLACIGAHSDVFGLGAILCEILTGKPPYLGTTTKEVQEKAKNADLAEAFERLEASATDRDLINLARRCLAADPKQRPKDAEEVAKALLAYQNGLQSKLETERLARATLRWRLAVAAVGMALVLGVAGAGLWYKLDQDQRAINDARTAGEAARVQAEKAGRDAAREREVREGLENLVSQLRTEHWAAAEATLQRIAGRLAEGGLEPLQAQARSARLDLEFVKGSDLIRQQRLFLVDGGDFDDNSVLTGYAGLFERYGLLLSTPEESAARIRTSPIKVQILAALDYWALLAKEPLFQHDILRLAHKASDTRWEQQFRDLGNRRNPARLANLVASAPLDRLQAVEIETLAWTLRTTGSDSEGLLRLGQKRFPADFWINLLMAQSIELQARTLPRGQHRWRRFEEAISYTRAAIALSPAYAYPYEFLGRLLTDCARFDEADAAFGNALRRQPEMGSTYYAQAQAWMARGNLRKAETVNQEALRFVRKRELLPLLHEQQGRIFLRQGRCVAAKEAFTRALERPLGVQQTRESIAIATEACLGLASALVGLGDCNGAKNACQRATQLQPESKAAPELLRRIEALLELERKGLTACLLGTYQPLSSADSLLAAELCLIQRQPLVSVRYFEQAFAGKPSLASTPSSLFFPLTPRSQAARAALLASAGQGLGSTPMAEKERTALRAKALSWLAQDLQSSQAMLADAPLEAALSIRSLCGVWLSHTDLAGIREPSQLSALSREEQQACRAFWVEVEALRKKAEARP